MENKVWKLELRFEGVDDSFMDFVLRLITMLVKSEGAKVGGGFFVEEGK